jgi:hypothetical protein
MKSALRGKEISSQGHGKRPKGRLALPPFEGHLKPTSSHKKRENQKKEGLSNPEKTLKSLPNPKSPLFLDSPPKSEKMKAAAFDPPFRFRNINRIPFRYGSGRVSKKFFKDFSEFPLPQRAANPL